MATLSIRCNLLLGSYQAADPFAGPETPEWPPHPYRLHAALVGAACELGGAEPAAEDIEALRWLERQGQPAISCDMQVSHRTAPEFYVPRNPLRPEIANSNRAWKKDRKFVSPWLRNARRFPTAIPGAPTVTYVWHDTQSIPAPLERLVSTVAWLGSSRSPVGCTLVDTPEPPQLVPAARGTLSLRVASVGITDALLGSRHQWPSAVQPPVVSYEDREAPTQDLTVTPGPLGEMLVLSISNPVHDLNHAWQLTTAIRLALLSEAGDAAPASLHGHGADDDHGAFLALPDVGHRHATGLIRGLAVALPRTVAPGDRKIIVTALSGLLKKGLGLGHGLATVKLASSGIDLIALRPERWNRPSRTFATVTPVILDRFPSRSRTAADELIASLKNAGFPEVDVEVLGGTATRGGAQVGQLRGELPTGKRVHARVRFAKPVSGPVIAGRGRYRGVGLFLPVPDWAEDVS